MTTILSVIVMFVAALCVALGLRELVSFRRWLRHIRRAESQYLERSARRRTVQA